MKKPIWLMSLWPTILIVACSAPPRPAIAADDPFARARQRMVLEQLTGPGRDITNAQVIRAMGKVPRQEFVPEALRSQAYQDRALPIGQGQTISQPYVVAFMTEQLERKLTHKVLEIGTGSGYQAAVLADYPWIDEVARYHHVDALRRRAGRARSCASPMAFA